MDIDAARQILIDYDAGDYRHDTADLLADTLGEALDEIHKAQVAAWDEGATYAAIECGAIDREDDVWIAPGDNPYREENVRS